MKNKELVHGEFSLKFRTKSDNSVEFLMHQNPTKSWQNASDIAVLDGLIEHAKNHLNKYYNAREDNEYVDQVLKVGSIVKLIRNISTLQQAEIGKLYVVLGVDNIGGVDLDIKDGYSLYFYSDEIEVIQY